MGNLFFFLFFLSERSVVFKVDIIRENGENGGLVLMLGFYLGYFFLVIMFRS